MTFLFFFENIQVRTFLGDAKLNIAMFRLARLVSFSSRYFFKKTITWIKTCGTEDHVAIVRV